MIPSVNSFSPFLASHPNLRGPQQLVESESHLVPNPILAPVAVRMLFQIPVYSPTWSSSNYSSSHHLRFVTFSCWFHGLNQPIESVESLYWFPLHLLPCLCQQCCVSLSTSPSSITISRPICNSQVCRRVIVGLIDIFRFIVSPIIVNPWHQPIFNFGTCR